MNGILQHEYGVTMEDIHWFIGGLTTPTQRPLIPLKLPGKIKVEFLPADRTLEGMLESGELHALLAIYIPSIFQKGSPRIARLFPNYYDVEQDYYRRTGIFPIMDIRDQHSEYRRRQALDNRRRLFLGEIFVVNRKPQWKS